MVTSHGIISNPVRCLRQGGYVFNPVRCLRQGGYVCNPVLASTKEVTLSILLVTSAKEDMFLFGGLFVCQIWTDFDEISDLILAKRMNRLDFGGDPDLGPGVMTLYQDIGYSVLTGNYFIVETYGYNPSAPRPRPACQ